MQGPGFAGAPPGGRPGGYPQAGGPGPIGGGYQGHAGAAFNSGGGAPVGPPATQGLPPGWVAATDPATNHAYYVNQMTGQTSWQKPS